MKRELERIYSRHRQGLFTLALTITRSQPLAEDAVHEAFVRLWRTRSQPAGDPVAYAFAAVRHAAIDQVRRRPPELPAVSIFNGRAPGPDDVAMAAERERRIAEALDALPAPQREAIVMRIYAGLSFRQIAEAVGAPLQTVAARYRRGLGRLRDTIPRAL